MSVQIKETNLLPFLSALAAYVFINHTNNHLPSMTFLYINNQWCLYIHLYLYLCTSLHLYFFLNIYTICMCKRDVIIRNWLCNYGGSNSRLGRFETQELLLQFKVKNKTKIWCHSSKQSGTRSFLSPIGASVCYSIQSFTWLDKAHPHLGNNVLYLIYLCKD